MKKYKYLWIIMVIYISTSYSFGADKFALENITLPPNFKIRIFADQIPNARSITPGPEGVFFVGTRSEGKVYAVLDKNGDFKADKIVVIDRNLWMPNGVAYINKDLYVAEIHRVIKYKDIIENLYSPGHPEVVNDSFPGKRWHGWKFIRLGPDRKLYVPVGAPCNVCVRKDERFSTIMRMNPDGSNLEVFARGVRNTVGFDWHPKTNELWFTDNGRDYLGDDLPPDELNHAPKPDQHFGFPYYHGKSITDRKFGKIAPKGEYTPPVQELGPHVAALGMRFYTGQMFPEKYQNQVFIAEHGSWNRSEPIGYRITVVYLKESRSIGYEIFAEGWLQSGATVMGRPVDIEVLKDGSMLVTDDHAGKIYRITYEPKSRF